VSTWAAGIAAGKAASVAWLTLDPYDDDPARFWTSVVAALQTIDPMLGREVLPVLSKLTSPPLKFMGGQVMMEHERKSLP
jgi:LuxR family maltose regulon positive regulatory protein